MGSYLESLSCISFCHSSIQLKGKEVESLHIRFNREYRYKDPGDCKEISR